MRPESNTPPRPVLRNPELQSAYPRDQRPRVRAAPVAKPPFAALAFLRGKRLRHLRFERRLHKRLNRRAHEIRVSLQKRFDRDGFCLTLLSGHGLLPRQRVGDVTTSPAYHGRSMPRGICRTLRTLPSVGRAGNESQSPYPSRMRSVDPATVHGRRLNLPREVCAAFRSRN